MNRSWRLVALLSLTATASYLSRVNLSVAGVQVMREYGLSQEAMGRIFSAFLAGYALFQIPAGYLADRFGAARILTWAAAAWVACIAWMAGPATTMATLLAARFLLGIAEAPTFPAAAQAIAQWMPEHTRGRANGAVIAAIGLGSAIAPPLVTYFMIHRGWRVALLVSAIPALTAAILWLAVKTPQHKAASTPQPRDPIPVTRQFALLTVSYSLQGYVGYIFVFWFYLYLVDVRHFDLLRGAIFGSFPWLLSIVSIPLGGALFDRLGPYRKAVPITGLAGSGVLTAVGAYTANPWIAAVALALATALVLSVEGPFWATMTGIARGRTGTAGGIMNMGSNLGGFISPLVTPMIAAAFGWEAALLFSGTVSIAAALLWLGI